MHGDIIPIGKLLGDTAIARGIVFFEIVERRIGKHYAEAERIVGAIALIDGDLGRRPLLPKQDRGVETRRSAADDHDLHEGLRRKAIGPFRYFKPKASIGKPTMP